MIRTFARSRPSDAAAAVDDGDDLFSYFVTHCCHRLFVLFVSCVAASSYLFLHTLTLPIVLHILPWCYFTCAQWLLSYQSECCLFLPSLLASWSSRCSIMYQQHIDWKRLSHTLCIYALKFLVKRGMRWVMKREGNRDNSMGTNFNRLQFKCYHCVYEAVRVFLSLSFFSLCVC